MRNRTLCAVVAAALLAVAVLAGCGDDAPEPVEPGVNQLEMTSDAGESYLLFVPSGHDPDTPIPLVVALHGQPGTSQQVLTSSDLDGVAEQQGFLVAYPDNFFDAGKVRTLVDELVEERNADRDAVYAAGFSAGGMLSWRLAAGRDNPFAAIASVGGPYRPAVDASPPEVPVSVISFVGLDDRRFVGDVDDGLATWRETQGCVAGEPTWVDDREEVSRTTATCEDGSEVAEYRIAHMGHTWPSRVGTFAPDELIWDFFAAHPRS